MSTAQRPKRDRKDYDRSLVADRVRLLVEILNHQAGWTKAEFARRCSLSPSQLSHYLAGTHDPEIDSLAKMAGALGVSMEWLIFGAGPMWAADLDTDGYGPAEATLAIASLLDDVSNELRRTVARKAPDDERKAPASNLGPMLQNRLRRLATAN